MHVIIIASLVLLFAFPGKAQTGMEVNVPRCSESPDLQAGLEARAWNPAIVLSNFYQIAETNKPASAVTARLMRDDNWFYVGMDIRHPSAAFIAPKLGQRNGRVQGEDCVKLALAPGAQGSDLYIFRLSAGNIKADQHGYITWNVPWRSAVKRTETGWQGIMAIPLKTLAGKTDWNVARVNLIALVYRKILDANLVVVDEERLLFSWQSVSAKWWNDLDRYGRLNGLDGGSQPSILPGWTPPVVEGYSVSNGKYQYAVRTEVRNESGQTGMVWIGVSDRPVTGKGGQVNVAVPLGAGETKPVRVAVPVGSFGKRGVTVTMGDEEGNDAWDRLALDDVDVLSVCGLAYLDRNYYTTEKTAWATIRLNFPLEVMNGMTVRVNNEKGDLLGSAPAARISRVGFDVGAMKEGKTALRFMLLDDKKAPVHSQTLCCIKRSPRTAGEWKIDKENRRVLRNGEPFFARGIVLHPGDGKTEIRASPDFADAVPDVKSAGFNALFLFGHPYLSVTNMLYPFEIARQHDMPLMPVLDVYAGKRNELYSWRNRVQEGPYAGLSLSQRNQVYMDVFRGILPRLLETARTIKDHPNMLGYYIGEEPTIKSVLDQITAGHELYNQLIENDGYHPSVVLYHGAPPAGDESYVTWCDILGNDPYWVQPAQAGGRRSRDINYVSEQTIATWQRAEVIRGPVWIVPVAEIWSGTHKRPISSCEQFCQTYLALIHGAKGFFYFTHPWKYQYTYDVFKSLNKQLETLGPIVLAPDIEQAVKYSPGDLGGVLTNYPAVQVALKQRPKGGYVLLAANSKPWPVDVQYRISNLREGDMVTRLFADWKTPVKDGMFGEQLEGFGVRAYVIPMQQNTNLPTALSLQPAASIQIQVSMQAHPEMITPEEDIPKSGRSGKKNLLPNPGFELATIPGVPDYVGGPANCMGPRVGLPGAWFEMSTNRPFEGKYCLQLANYHDVQGAGQGFSFYLEPQLDKPAKFVFSAYMRADRDDLAWPNRSDPLAGWTYMTGRGSGLLGHTKVKLTKEWKRYHAVVEIPAGANRQTMFSVAFYGRGMVWVDAMQIEKGETPTEYEP